MKKKLFSLLLSVLVLVGLASCGSTSNSSTTTDTTKDTTTDTTGSSSTTTDTTTGNTSTSDTTTDVNKDVKYLDKYEAYLMLPEETPEAFCYGVYPKVGIYYQSTNLNNIQATLNLKNIYYKVNSTPLEKIYLNDNPNPRTFYALDYDTWSVQYPSGTTDGGSLASPLCDNKYNLLNNDYFKVTGDNSVSISLNSNVEGFTPNAKTPRVEMFSTNISNFKILDDNYDTFTNTDLDTSFYYTFNLTADDFSNTNLAIGQLLRRGVKDKPFIMMAIAPADGTYGTYPIMKLVYKVYNQDNKLIEDIQTFDMGPVIEGVDYCIQMRFCIDAIFISKTQLS